MEPVAATTTASTCEEITEKGLQALIQWCRRTLHPYTQFQNMNSKTDASQLNLPDIDGFGECWKNGLAFVTLLHRHRLLYDYTFISLTKRTPKENIELALETAHSALGLDVSFIDPDEHILTPKRPDESRVMKFVLGIYHKTQAHRQFDSKGANLVELRKELSKLQEQNERLRFESQFAKEQLEESEKETKVVKKELKTERDMRMSLERRKEVGKETGNDESAEITIKELQKRLEKEVEERNRFKKHLAEEMMKNSELEYKILQFEKRNGGLGIVLQKRLSIDAKLVPSAMELLHLRTELEEKERKLILESEASSDYKRQIKEKEREIERLHQLLLATKKSSQDLKRQLSANQDMVVSLESERRKLERKNSDTSAISQARLEERLAEAERQKKKLEASFAELKAEADQSIVSKEKLDRTVASLEAKVKRLTSKLDDEEKQKESLEKQLRALKTQSDSLQKTCNEQAKKITELERRTSPRAPKKQKDKSDDKH